MRVARLPHPTTTTLRGQRLVVHLRAAKPTVWCNDAFDAGHRRSIGGQYEADTSERGRAMGRYLSDIVLAHTRAVGSQLAGFVDGFRIGSMKSAAAAKTSANVRHTRLLSAASLA